jgi:hypothetical protein
LQSKEDLAMTNLRLVLITTVTAFLLNPQTAAVAQTLPQAKAPATCRNARPTHAFIPPAPYETASAADWFFIGNEKLWTEAKENMVWQWTPHGPGHEQDLTAKIFWGRIGYNWRTEPVPKLRVSGKRLDGPSAPLVNPQGPATNVIGDDTGRGFMLTGVWIPTPGCWEITGNYEGDKLSFVVWVEPAKEARK